MNIRTRFARGAGLLRSVLMYHGIPFRRRRLTQFYAQFIQPGDLCFDIGAHVGSRLRAWTPLGARIVAVGEEARELLNAPATADLAPVARDRFIAKAKEELPGLLKGSIAEFVRSRAQELMADHARLRVASGSASRVTVEAVLPPDVIGLFTLMPGEA